jgi:hypothetical protein
VRYSLKHKAQNHENILTVAARSFREHGGDSSGIGTVMKKVGLTKGGFYRHFKSKDEARDIMETLPLAKEQVWNTEYIPVGPLMPLRALTGPGAQQ